jgi:hypothetical protein
MTCVAPANPAHERKATPLGGVVRNGSPSELGLAPEREPVLEVLHNHKQHSRKHVSNWHKAKGA